MKRIGLYFGTFNPIHVGHLVIANHMAEFSDLDEVWFVITPQSPFKVKKTLLDNNHRYQMVFEAIKEYPKLKASRVEFKLPQPNYTVHTLAYISEKHPTYRFALIMGEDNLKSFPKWKNHEVILENHELYVYPRISEGELPEVLKDHPRINRVAAPIMELSSTFIRRSHKEGKDIRPMLPDAVWRYMDEMNFYR